ncbi:hypothetical protein FRC17_002022 [Serendipita sp. 399]|nr:hypothetical protein FRC17_002022 [Serendipita sp. 399]
MLEPLQPPECNQKGCKRPIASLQRASCQYHLDAARLRAHNARAKRQAASKPHSDPLISSNIINDASKIGLGGGSGATEPTPTQPRKRKRVESKSLDENKHLSKRTKWLVPKSWFNSQEELLKALRVDYGMKKGVLVFDAAYTTPDGSGKDSMEKRNENDLNSIHILAQSIWEYTRRRWTLKYQEVVGYGVQTKWYCSQDCDHRRPTQKNNDESKHRDRESMETYECRSKLSIRVYHQDDNMRRVHIHLEHYANHPQYYDIDLPPAALEIVQKYQWANPAHVAQQIRSQKEWQHIKTYQIRHVWRKLSEKNWRLNEDQLVSAHALLKKHVGDVDLLEIESIEGVITLGFGLKHIASALKNVVEIGMDATYNTNAKDLELYVVMAEHDNRGIPIAYLFLSTATSIENLKRKNALEAFLRLICDKYGLKPRFVHTDKDVAEIRAAQAVWPDAKHQLCQWHQQRAVKTRVMMRKLATTRYNARRANSAYQFIDPAWKPRVKSDPNDNEGDDVDGNGPYVASSASQVIPSTQPTGPNVLPKIRLMLPPRLDPLPSQATIMGLDGDEEEAAVDEEESKDERQFCPEPFRKPLLAMIHRHANAHPLIPGDHAPTAEGVREWAVRKAYNFCRDNELPELWAYLWENWYRSGRWELWARAPCSEIPRLRTTMICESQLSPP